MSPYTTGRIIFFYLNKRNLEKIEFFIFTISSYKKILFGIYCRINRINNTVL